MNLVKIQQELKAPKGQTNSFGKYKYRSAEDIIEAAKPICHKYECALLISDEMVMLGDRYYIKSTATITDGSIIINAIGWAREEETKKGMDAAQITGSASSYARKYALNGLFAIDDTKDSDATNDHKDEIGQDKRLYLLTLLEAKTWTDEVKNKLAIKIENMTTLVQYNEALKSLK